MVGFYLNKENGRKIPLSIYVKTDQVDLAISQLRNAEFTYLFKMLFKTDNSPSTLGGLMPRISAISG